MYPRSRTSSLTFRRPSCIRPYGRFYEDRVLDLGEVDARLAFTNQSDNSFLTVSEELQPFTRR